MANALDFFIDGATATDYHEGNVQIPIVGRGVKSERESPENLATIGIRTSSGGSVPLSQVADVYTVGELNRIMRYNQERTITVSAKNQVLKASEIFAALAPTLDAMEFPKHHFWELGGELEDSARAQKNLAKWMLPCFGGIVFLLVWQFNSIRRAAIIILTMPLVIVGAVVGLLVRLDHHGVSSTIRWLRIQPEAYESFLAFFRSKGLRLHALLHDWQLVVAARSARRRGSSSQSGK